MAGALQHQEVTVTDIEIVIATVTEIETVIPAAIGTVIVVVVLELARRHPQKVGIYAHQHNCASSTYSSVCAHTHARTHLFVARKSACFYCSIRHTETLLLAHLCFDQRTDVMSE